MMAAAKKRPRKTKEEMAANAQDAVFGMMPFEPESIHDSRATRAEIEEMQFRERRAFLTKRKNRLVWAIAKLMACGEYDKRQTLRKIAAEEDMALSALQNISAEAARVLDFCTNGGRRELVHMSRVRLMEIAMENGKDRVQALRTVLENLGELRQKIKVSRDEDFFAGWSEDEMAVYAETGKLPKVGEV